ncbi:unnamed protein product [Bemisia tabaci]|uniref:Uncharacterized protein n=1 Tax=Bemisia tabaci TaxID=7038 RepID=A0A9P0F9P1_BEMTA|nr:unnamed protein product [Bemisia tabaci]
MKIEEDKQFLIQQREKGRPGHMYGLDWELARKEARSAEQEQLRIHCRRKHNETMEKLGKFLFVNVFGKLKIGSVNMPQYHKKKSERGQTEQDAINLAVAAYIEAGKRGLRTIAKKNGIPKSSFEQYVKGETCSKLSDRVKQFGSRYSPLHASLETGRIVRTVSQRTQHSYSPPSSKRKSKFIPEIFPQCALISGPARSFRSSGSLI